LALSWADAHHARTGHWPTVESGPVAEAPEETWAAIGTALRTGGRGLEPDSSLPRLLAEHRGVRNHMARPPLTPVVILAWADAHFRRTGAWPHAKSGSIPGAGGETWQAVARSLEVGLRGLPGDDTLARFLERRRGKRNKKALQPFTVGQLRRWVLAHHRWTGEWPRRTSGHVHDSPGDTWEAVNQALSRGQRGLPGGSSLSPLVQECQETVT
jgi:hypothetical protein